MAVREQWLEKRHQMILPMMRQFNIDMWIVVNEEFHDDPLTQYVAPPRPYAGGRDIFIFVDTGEKGLRRIAIAGFAEENLKHFFESPDEPCPADKVLPELYEQYKPQKIALSFGPAGACSAASPTIAMIFLVQKMGTDAAQHFVPAADLIEEYLDTRIPEEFDTYTTMVQLTDVLTLRALSMEASGKVNLWPTLHAGCQGWENQRRTDSPRVGLEPASQRRRRMSCPDGLHSEVPGE